MSSVKQQLIAALEAEASILESDAMARRFNAAELRRRGSGPLPSRFVKMAADRGIVKAEPGRLLGPGPK